MRIIFYSFLNTDHNTTLINTAKYLIIYLRHRMKQLPSVQCTRGDELILAGNHGNTDIIVGAAVPANMRYSPDGGSMLVEHR